MTTIVCVSLAVAVASIIVPLVWRRGFGSLDSASLAALAVMGDLISLLACLLVSLANWIRGDEVRFPLGAVAFSGVALLWCIARHAHVTKPREVPRHVNPAWNIPTRATSQLMVNLFAVHEDGETTRLEVITADGHFTMLTTSCEPERCRRLAGHRAVLLLDVTDPTRVVDLFDLGVVGEDEITTAPPATPQLVNPDDDHLNPDTSAVAS